MQRYLAKVREIEKEFADQGISIQYSQMSKTNNEEVDLLSRLSMKKLEQLSREVYVEEINNPSFEKTSLVIQQ